MIALRKLWVFLPQMVGLAVATAGPMGCFLIGKWTVWIVPLVVLTCVAVVTTVIGTLEKTDAITNHGWGHFDAALDTACASCRGYRLTNERLKRQLGEAREALTTLRLP